MSTKKMRQTRSMYPKWLSDYLKEQGVSHQLLAQVSGLEVGFFDDEKAPWPLDAYLTLFEWAAEYTGHPHLGLMLARRSDADELGLLGFLGASGRTFGEMYSYIERYQRILMQGAFVERREHDDYVEIRYSVVTGLKDKLAQDVEFTMALVVNLIQNISDNHWTPSRSSFEHKGIFPLDDYQSLFGNGLSFEQPHNSLWIEKSIWDIPLPTANSTLLDVLTEQANTLLERIESQDDFLGRVRFLIGHRLGDETFNLEVLAYELNMSSRTLHRKLKQENTSFKEIKLELMMNIAKDALVHQDLSVTDLAQTLGYSESSAFVRVFKRLQGVSPLQYRKKNGLSQ